MGRQRWILQRLRHQGTIDQRTYDAALAEPLEVLPADPTSDLAPHVSERIQRALAGSGAPPQAVRTTLDAGLQADVSGIARRYRSVLAKYGASNVAVVVLDFAHPVEAAQRGQQIPAFEKRVGFGGIECQRIPARDCGGIGPAFPAGRDQHAIARRHRARRSRRQPRQFAAFDGGFETHGSAFSRRARKFG